MCVIYMNIKEELVYVYVYILIFLIIYYCFFGVLGRLVDFVKLKF